MVMILAFLLLTGKAYGFGDNSYSYLEAEERQITVRKQAEEIRPEPVTPVDRHVLSSEDYKRDPSILIAYAKEIKREFIIKQDLDIMEIRRATQDAAIEAAKNERVHVKARWCDNTHCDKWEEVKQ